MKTACSLLLLVAVLAGLALHAKADDRKWKLPVETATLKPAAGVELANGQCLLCHSADYVAMQPPMERAAWRAIVVKMREKYGSPLPTNQVDSIADYLVANYGKRMPPK